MPVSEDDPYVVPPPVHGGGSGIVPVLHPYDDDAYTPQPVVGIAYAQTSGLGTTGLADVDATVNSVVDVFTLLTCGRLSIDMAGVTARTISATETLNMMLSFYGSPGGAATATMPTTPRLWVIRNGTNQTLTLKCSGQTGITVAAAKTQLLYCNGFDVYAVTAAL